MCGEATSPESAEGENSCLTHHLTCATRMWSPLPSGQRELYAYQGVAIIPAIENRVCSAQHPGCADQKPSFHISQLQKQERTALMEKIIFGEQSKKR